MWRRYLLISITHFWLIQVISLTNSKDSKGKEVFFRDDNDEFILAREDDETTEEAEPEKLCQKFANLVDCDDADTSNKTCRRFKTIVDENVTIEPPRNPDLVTAMGVFEYIGTKKESGKGDVFLSTNVEGNHSLVYNWANDEGSTEGWVGSVVVAGSSWEDLLSGAQKLFFTVYPHLCKEKYIENCTFGKWKTKRDNEESVDDPGLSFECEIPPIWSDWKEASDCKLFDLEEGCGEGNMTMNRNCTDGNIEECENKFEERTTKCSVPCTTTGAAITTKISLSGKTNDIGNNSETIETTDTTKKIDDQKTDPKTTSSSEVEDGDGATKGRGKTANVENIALLFFSIVILKWKMTITN